VRGPDECGRLIGRRAEGVESARLRVGDSAAIAPAAVARLIGRFHIGEALTIAFPDLGAAALQQRQDLRQQFILRIAVVFSTLDLVQTDSIVADLTRYRRSRRDDVGERLAPPLRWQPIASKTTVRAQAVAAADAVRFSSDKLMVRG